MTIDRDVKSVVNDIRTRGKVDYISTGFPGLDSILGGLVDGDVCVIAARPSQGKTSFAVDFLRRACERGKKVGMVSLEMSAESLVHRLVAGYTGVDVNLLRFGLAPPDRERDVEKVMKGLENMPAVFNDDSSMTGEQFMDKAVAWKELGVQLMVMDYVQLMNGEGDSRQFQVAEAMRTIKQAARATGIPVICLAQLSRQAERDADGHPKLSHLRDSGEIENSADQVVFIHPLDEHGTVELVVAKNRHGKRGSVSMNFDPVRMRFNEGEEVTI